MWNGGVDSPLSNRKIEFGDWRQVPAILRWTGVTPNQGRNRTQLIYVNGSQRHGYLSQCHSLAHQISRFSAISGVIRLYGLAGTDNCLEPATIFDSVLFDLRYSVFGRDSAVDVYSL